MKKIQRFKDWCRSNNIGMTKGYELINEKKIKVIKLGRGTYITDEEGDRFIDSLMEKVA